jgi:hypothetical protein
MIPTTGLTHSTNRVFSSTVKDSVINFRFFLNKMMMAFVVHGTMDITMYFMMKIISLKGATLAKVKHQYALVMHVLLIRLLHRHLQNLLLYQYYHRYLPNGHYHQYSHHLYLHNLYFLLSRLHLQTDLVLHQKFHH